ncbi:Dnah7 [Symbiodinium natans]|uniref:Dnah7 protein n=1 Tax=Symbiodinium natans TaxID=878477 RepID=A0A812V1U7_9DINO|nr:Dnah7 [Symbiodinium natans]
MQLLREAHKSSFRLTFPRLRGWAGSANRVWTCLHLETFPGDDYEDLDELESASSPVFARLVLQQLLQLLHNAFQSDMAAMENGRKMGQEILKLLQQAEDLDEPLEEPAPLKVSRTSRRKTRHRDDFTDTSSRGGNPRLCCNFILAMGREYVPTIIGRGGANTKSIHEETGCKVRVRGRGSGHLEQQSNEEAPTNLMLAVTAEPGNKEGFIQAVAKSLLLLWNVDERYQQDCRRCGVRPSSPSFYISVENEDVKMELAEVFGKEFTTLIAPGSLATRSCRTKV